MLFVVAVFKYDPPNVTTFPHSVYLLKDFRSFMTCNLKRATLVGNVVQGGGTGFEFVLKESKPYYFACGEHSGIHCKVGLMKFFVWPLKPPCRGWRRSYPGLVDAVTDIQLSTSIIKKQVLGCFVLIWLREFLTSVLQEKVGNKCIRSLDLFIWYNYKGGFLKTSVFSLIPMLRESW